MIQKKVYVKDLMNKLGYECITGDEKALNREIKVPDVNRPGLELTGYYLHSQRERVVLLGNKEMGFISGMSNEVEYSSFDFLTQKETPCIIITRDLACPAKLKEIAQRKNFPLLLCKDKTSRAMVEVVTYLDSELAPMKTMHGVFLQIYGKGVMLTGESGMGKSEIALELIKKGHLLVADDRVDCAVIHKQIIGQAPEILKQMLEIRGVGIINVSKMFGVASVLDKATVDLNIHIEPWKPDKQYDRLGSEEKKYTEILGVQIPKLVIPVKEGRSMGVIIESAVTNYLLSSVGQDSAKEFEQRVLNLIERNKNGE